MRAGSLVLVSAAILAGSALASPAVPSERAAKAPVVRRGSLPGGEPIPAELAAGLEVRWTSREPCFARQIAAASPGSAGIREPDAGVR
jgi:hypothetical protein